MSDRSEETPAESESTARRPEKKKRKQRGAPRTFLRPPLNARGQERPQFLLNFPEDPELERLIWAFERGDYLTVRREAPALAERTPDADIKSAALELRRRVDPDPMLKYLIGISVGLLLFLTIYLYASR